MSDVLARVVRREPLLADGKSGSPLERAWLDDGTALVIKHVDAANDWIMQATGDSTRLADLWAEGFFASTPPSIDHTMIDVQRTTSGAVVVMRDATSDLFSPAAAPPRSAHLSVLRAAARVHQQFSTPPSARLCPLGARYSFLSPAVCARFAESHFVPRLAVGAWDRFHELVATDVASAVAAIHADPSAIERTLSARPSTVLHGDLKLGNLGAHDDRVVMLDWGTLTAWGPPAIDFSWYLAINAAGLGISHDQLLDDVTRVAGPDHDEFALHVALLGALAQLGWEKALGATSNDEATRVREREGLSWWERQAQLALEIWTP